MRSDHAEWRYQQEEEWRDTSEASSEEAQRMCRHVAVQSISSDIVRCLDCLKLLPTVTWAVDRARTAK